jgi:hypothetical protein
MIDGEGGPMRNPWQTVIEAVLRPARPDLARCLAERETLVASQRGASDARARAIEDCERRIERCRAGVFAARDGVVPALMTELEREWRRLSHRDIDGAAMDLWARIAPAGWIDRRRWQDTGAALRLDAAVTLAADVAGVQAAEAAVDALRAALAAWGTALGSPVRWRLLELDAEHTGALYAELLRGARPDVAVLERATRLQDQVHQAALARLPARPLLARDVGRAAFVDCVWRSAAADRPDPVAPLRALWQTGYVLSAVDASGVTLELPRL